MRREGESIWGVVWALLGAAWLAGATACGDGGGDSVTDGDSSSGSSGGGGGDGFSLDYRAGADALLDLQVTASLGFAGEKPTLPALSSIGVAQAHAIVLGNGQQIIDVTLSSADALEVGERFSVTLEFSRANEGDVIDSGGTLDMSCGFYWSHADDSSVALSGSCDVRRSGGGYEVTVRETYDENTQLSGTVTFGPVPNEIVAYTPGDGCASDQICLSLDPDEYEPATGYCMPTTNLKSQAQPCSADCSQQLVIEVGSEETCICTAACGILGGGGGGDPPVCDPAYGCIDF